MGMCPLLQQLHTRNSILYLYNHIYLNLVYTSPQTKVHTARYLHELDTYGTVLTVRRNGPADHPPPPSPSPPLSADLLGFPPEKTSGRS